MESGEFQAYEEETAGAGGEVGGEGEDVGIAAGGGAEFLSQPVAGDGEVPGGDFARTEGLAEGFQDAALEWVYLIDLE